MKKTKMPLSKKLLTAAGILVLLLAVCAGAFFWYVSDYYPAEDMALEVLARDSGITVQDNLTVLSPTVPSGTAIIFYPGAKVEAEAYLPLLEQIKQTGVTCILVHMPFRMAIFAAGHPDQVEGLILLGAYIYGDYPDEKTLTVYGSLNQSVEDHIDYTENIVEIEGGNHAQFGNYGPQKGDLPAAISAEEQQRQTVEAIKEFMAP